MMVVSSLVMTTRSAVPSMSMVTFSSLVPRSSETNWPLGEDRDVLEHGLAAVAEAGGLDGGDLEDAADLVQDEGGEGVALDVLGDDRGSGGGSAAAFSRNGRKSWALPIFFSWMRISGFSRTASMRSGSVTK